MGGKAPKPVPIPAPIPLPVYTPPPLPEPVPAMPTPDDAAIEAAKKKEMALQMQRSGRASTMLSNDDEDTLG